LIFLLIAYFAVLSVIVVGSVGFSADCVVGYSFIGYQWLSVVWSFFCSMLSWLFCLGCLVNRSVVCSLDKFVGFSFVCSFHFLLMAYLVFLLVFLFQDVLLFPDVPLVGYSVGFFPNSCLGTLGLWEEKGGNGCIVFGGEYCGHLAFIQPCIFVKYS
jgi:hypothetical protein